MKLTGGYGRLGGMAEGEIKKRARRGAKAEISTQLCDMAEDDEDEFESVEEEIENTISFLVEHHVTKHELFSPEVLAAGEAECSGLRIPNDDTRFRGRRVVISHVPEAKDNWDDLRDRLFTAEEVSEAQIAAAKRSLGLDIASGVKR